MDETQSNHLKAYGAAYWVLSKDEPIEWMLNYKGGSFMMPALSGVENELVIRGVSYQVISDADAARLAKEISVPTSNMDMMRLETVPKLPFIALKPKCHGMMP